MPPKNPRIPPTPPRLTEVLAFPEVQLLDVAGPIQVFTAANELAAKAEAPTPYAIRVVAPKGKQVRATSGLTFVTAPLPDPAEPLDTLIVAGGQGVMRAAATRACSTGCGRAPAGRDGSRRSAPAPSSSRRRACSTAAVPSRTGNIATCLAVAIPP
jgi:hypothetical protein